MTDFPQVGIPPLFINSYSRYACLPQLAQANMAMTSLTWVANKAIYIPFQIPWPYPVRRVFWGNGSAVTATNRDFGIYSADGTQIYHTGSTAASGVSVLQYVTPTEFLLAPGRYFMAIASDTSTASRGGAGTSASTNIAKMAMAGLLEQSTAFPLPATMTPVTMVLTVFPLCGITQTASGF